MKLIGMGRIGRDAEIRYMTDGTPVAGVSVAWSFGRKDETGKQQSQWAELSLWGDRAEKLAPYLLRGQQIFAVVSDVHTETYDKRDGGVGVKLVGRIDSVEFGARPAGADGGQGAAPAPAPAQRQQAQGGGYGGYTGGGGPARTQQQRTAAPAPAPQRAASGFDDLDDDQIPF